MSGNNIDFSINKKIDCGDMVLDLNKPKIMGILNMTEDSFFDGGRYNKGEKYLYRAAELIEAGAAIIDIGAASTRPGASLINEKDEWSILKDPIIELRKNFPNTFISIDTYNSGQVKKCAELGVHLINDISGGSWDDHMYTEVAKQKMGYIMMHIQGNPGNMQDAPKYHSIIDDIITYFKERINTLHQLNFKNIIVDPGFGFGKTLEDNYQLLAQMKKIEGLNCPVLAGLSRKSMIFKALNINADEALNGTSVLNTFALQNGANILRVHDIKEANETIQLYLKYKAGGIIK